MGHSLKNFACLFYGWITDVSWMCSECSLVRLWYISDHVNLTISILPISEDHQIMLKSKLRMCPWIPIKYLQWRAVVCWSAQSRGCAAVLVLGGSLMEGTGRSLDSAGLTAAAGNTWDCWKTGLHIHNHAIPRHFVKERRHYVRLNSILLHLQPMLSFTALSFTLYYDRNTLFG